MAALIPDEKSLILKLENYFLISEKQGRLLSGTSNATNS